MDKIDNLLQQLYYKEYRSISFSIFNFIEEDGFITELYAVTKTQYDIDDFEFIKFDITDDLRSGIKYSKKDYIHFAYDFKNYVENELQKDVVKLKIYPIKQSGSLIAVKLKDFTIINSGD